MRPARFARPAPFLLDRAPQFFLAPQAAMDQRACVGTPGLAVDAICATPHSVVWTRGGQSQHDQPVCSRGTQMNANSRLACLSAAFLCSFFPIAHAESSYADWVADSHGCKVANPQPQPIESISWSGRCKDGFADGAGTVRWFSEGKSNGITSGTFKQGKLVGKGYVTLPHAVYTRTNLSMRDLDVRRAWPPGSRLDGEFLENHLIGDGTVTKPNGQKVVVYQFDGKLVRKKAVTAAATTPLRALPQ